MRENGQYNTFLESNIPLAITIYLHQFTERKKKRSV